MNKVPHLTFRVDPVGHVAAEVTRRIPAPDSSPKRRKALLVTLGSVTVRINRESWYSKEHRKKYFGFRLAWRDLAGKRQREKCPSLEAAKKRAETICQDIQTGEAQLGSFSQADKASLSRAQEILAAAGIITPLEVVVGIYTQCVQILRGGSPVEAARTHAALYPVDLAKRTVPDIVAEFFALRTFSAKWKRNLELMLDRFATKFPGVLNLLQAREIDDWLTAVMIEFGGGLRTRRNHRSAIENLINFAKARGYVAETWKVMASVSDPEPPATRVNIYTPDELVRLLTRAEQTKAGRKMVPFLCITAFAGVRHGEMNEEKARLLDWADIDFEEKGIYIQKEVAKTGDDRTVDMPENLIAWLQPYAQPSGRVCEVENTSNSLCRLRAQAKIKGPKKNALRKSFISYKLALKRDVASVADQAGNSPGVIGKSYRKSDTKLKIDAKRWFSIIPERAQLHFLFAGQKRDQVAL